jgi:hypothetical protein
VEIGDLVKPKSKKYYRRDDALGVVVKVEENFYRTYSGSFEDRLTVHWTCGIPSLEPVSYVEKVNENR